MTSLNPGTLVPQFTMSAQRQAVSSPTCPTCGSGDTFRKAYSALYDCLDCATQFDPRARDGAICIHCEGSGIAEPAGENDDSPKSCLECDGTGLTLSYRSQVALCPACFCKPCECAILCAICGKGWCKCEPTPPDEGYDPPKSPASELPADVIADLAVPPASSKPPIILIHLTVDPLYQLTICRRRQQPEYYNVTAEDVLGVLTALQELRFAGLCVVTPELYGWAAHISQPESEEYLPFSDVPEPEIDPHDLYTCHQCKKDDHVDNVTVIDGWGYCSDCLRAGPVILDEGITEDEILADMTYLDHADEDAYPDVTANGEAWPR